MNLIELEKIKFNKELELPFIFDNLDMKGELEEKFKIYMNFVNGKVNDKVYNNIVHISNVIIECISNYYNGLPDKAYQLFDIEIGNLIKQNSFYRYKFVRNEIPTLYRIRQTDIKLYGRNEIFHIPFKLRRNVSTSRYSILGYPSLYLSTSIDVCRMETDFKKRKSGIVAAFKFKRHENLRILDLSLKFKDLDFSETNFNSKEQISDYLELYPLIAACSIQKYNDNLFKPEYILPQILMQWLRVQGIRSSMCLGIKYFTTRSKNPTIKGYNYVFPTNYINDSMDYCTILVDQLNLTDLINFDDLSNTTELEEQLNNMDFRQIDF